MSSYIADIVSFFDAGTDHIIIHKLTGETDDQYNYAVEVDKQFSSPTYYLIDDKDGKINKLFERLKECGSEIMMTKNDQFKFKLIAPKYYEVSKTKEEQTKGLCVVVEYDKNPIGTKYTDDISELPAKEYGEVFGKFERQDNDGFPIF